VLTFTGSRDAEALRNLVREVARGAVRSVAFVIPSGITWPLPLYELALMTAGRARAAGEQAELALYTPESEPLAVFGSAAASDVAARLAEAGIGVVSSAEADVTPDGYVTVPSGETRSFDRVVALPRLHGPAPHGVPQDDRGFVPIDAHGLVPGVRHVYAAGDGTDFPVKHGGIACQQADAVAEVIAKRAGAGIDPRPFRRVVRGQLLTGDEPSFLQADLGARASERSEASDAPLWWPAAKIAGIHLGPYLAATEREGLPPPDTPQPSATDLMEIRKRLVFLPGEFENNPWGE
jgi:sulfide:quinone oxidoreductase